MPKTWNAEELFEWFVSKTIWFYLPFYALWRFGRELIHEIFSKEEK